MVLVAIPSAWMLDARLFKKLSANWPKGSYSPNAARDGLHAIATRHHIKFMDLTPSLNANLYYPYDGHLVPEGAKLAAEAIAREAF